MNLGLKDRVVLVAGASQGIGKAIAEEFAAEGATLALCARDPNNLRDTASGISSRYKVRVETGSVDVSKHNDVRNFVRDMASVFGRIDVCVPNAGGPPAMNFLATTQDDWQSAFETNLSSTVAFAQATIPHMQRQRWGRIVALTSMAVRQPLPQLVLSNTIRTGLLGLLRTISNEFASDGITANNVAPGYTSTVRLNELKSRLAKCSGRSEEDVERDWVSEIPAGRLASPEEVASAVVWLASERAAFITGQTIVVDGGMWKGI